MAQHDYTTRADWEEAAARYITDKSDSDEQFAKETARELADMHEADDGKDVSAWPHPTTSAHEEMLEWADSHAIDTCDEDDADADE